MKKMKLILACGAILASGGIWQTAHASIVLGTTYTSILADAEGSTSVPQALTVNWEVTKSGAIYTYSYKLNDPVGEKNATTGKEEFVDNFAVSFDTTVAGAVIAGSQTGGVFYPSSAGDLTWDITGIGPGSSATMTFQSYLPPTYGDADANDANLPSPWASAPYGQQVAVPVPEPTTMIAGAMLLLPFGASTLRSLRKHRTV
jgi:hypothetical protein